MFSVAAGAYDRFMGRYSTLLGPGFCEFSQVAAGQQVLDVGCGPGALTAELVERLGPENVAVYDVRPGLIATEMTAPVIESYRKRAAEGLTLFPRVGEPAEVGTVIAALAAGRLPYTTGQAIAVDGGMLLPRF